MLDPSRQTLLHKGLRQAFPRLEPGGEYRFLLPVNILDPGVTKILQPRIVQEYVRWHDGPDFLDSSLLESDRATLCER